MAAFYKFKIVFDPHNLGKVKFEDMENLLTFINDNHSTLYHAGVYVTIETKNREKNEELPILVDEMTGSIVATGPDSITSHCMARHKFYVEQVVEKNL
uniref:Uncharacterized protein n=1 Tax=Abalone asfa-like virus TaxID=2839893 RepID=A0A5K7XY66_9VIRU|nr:hypothetical protein [Abalone asfa-like virus]